MSLALAQLAVVFRAAQWTGEKNEELKSKASTTEIEKLRTEAAKEKGAIVEAATAGARSAVSSAIAPLIADEARELEEKIRVDVRRELERFDDHREKLAVLLERAKRFEEVFGKVEGLDEAITALRDAVHAWSRAGAKLEWRIESVEEALRRKFGSHPRAFAVREAPSDVGAPPYDPEATIPGIGQHPAFLPPPPAAPRPSPGALKARPPIPREEPDDKKAKPPVPRGGEGE